MPMLNLRCVNGHTSDRYFPTWETRFQELARFCDCGHPLLEQPGYPTPLLFFRENRTQFIDNLGVTIASHGEHTRVMKERGVEPATAWHTSRSRSDGLKTRAEKPHPKQRIMA